jgi:hypothetical protein
MGLESASYPNQLVATNPTGSDPKSTADDHIRLLKSVIQATFPNLTGAMTAAQADLNKVGVTQPQTSNDTSVSSTAFVQTAVASAITAIGAGASMWVSGTTYALGNVVWSPSNYQTYRRIIAGAGTTDPASDATNWVLVSGNVQTTATQTLTNKTLAAPVITGGASISGNVSVAGQVTSDTSNAQVQVIKGSNATGGYVYLYDSANSAGRGYIGWGPAAITGAAMADLCIAPASGGGSIRFGSVGGVGTNGMFDASGNFLPGTNGGQAFGSTALRWSQVWCTAGAFNTSDAKLKTKVSKFNDAEIQAAVALSKEIGWFQWLDSVKDKGEEKARHHVGLTVQRAAEVLESFGLDPWIYGFMSHDIWDDQITEQPAVEAKEALLDVDGNVIEESVEAKEAWLEITLKAGESYAFRYDQLNLFIARGIEARLAALEARA